MNRPFELEWMGGAPERLFRRRRRTDDLPWGDLDPSDHPPELVARARASWTEGAWSEYCSAAAFAQVQRALLAAAAPIDLIGVAGEFVADEMLHVELNARVAMALGGAEPVLVDMETDPLPLVGATALQRASEAVVRTCCVGEALSVPIIAGARRAAGRHPLIGAVLERIVADEGPHAMLGWWYLEWAADKLDDEERNRLATVALDELAIVAARWSEVSGDERWSLEDVNALGWMEASDYLETTRRAVRERVVEPLAKAGIVIRPEQLECIVRAA